MLLTYSVWLAAAEPLQQRIHVTEKWNVAKSAIISLHFTFLQTLNVVMPGIASGGTASQTVPAKVLDCDTITQVKEKLVEQTWKGTSFSQRPHVDSLHLGQSATV